MSYIYDVIPLWCNTPHLSWHCTSTSGGVLCNTAILPQVWPVQVWLLVTRAPVITPSQLKLPMLYRRGTVRGYLSKVSVNVASKSVKRPVNALYRSEETHQREGKRVYEGICGHLMLTLPIGWQGSQSTPIYQRYLQVGEEELSTPSFDVTYKSLIGPHIRWKCMWFYNYFEVLKEIRVFKCFLFFVVLWQLAAVMTPSYCRSFVS